MFKIIQDLYVNDFKIGDIICAHHNAKGWYRCEIKGVRKLENNKIDSNNNDDDFEIDVYYIDFGDSAYIKKCEARMLLAQFNELPCYAIQCTLNGVEPVNEEGAWNNDAIDFFEEVTYSCKWKILNAKLIGFKEEFGNRVPIIDLYDPDKVCF